MTLRRKVRVTLAIIAGDLGTDPQLLNLVRNGVREGYFEIAIQGWLHEDFAALDETQITELVRNVKERLQGLFPEAAISTLIPPFEEADSKVMGAAAANGLRYVTGDLLHGKPYDWNGVRYLPKTVDAGIPGSRLGDPWAMDDQATIIREVERSLGTYGYAIASFHPQQLTRTVNMPLVLMGMLIVGVIFLVSFFVLALRADKEGREA
jgi:peptidoglycan/xylan/chitin deacetylase (PgdA/CDA1 family)